MLGLAAPAGVAPRCMQCGHDVGQHLQGATEEMANRYRVPMAHIGAMLEQWWETSILWAWDSTHGMDRRMRDLNLAMDALHVLASNGPPGRSQFNDIEGGCACALGDGSTRNGSSGPSRGTTTHVGSTGRSTF